MSIWLLDTSILCELLQVPNCSDHYREIAQELKRKIERKDTLLLPMTSIFETGNLIGQNGNGTQRRQAALRFVERVREAIQGKAPFQSTPFFEQEQVLGWLEQFPKWVQQTDSKGHGSGFGDLSIVQEWERQRQLNPGKQVRIWSLDEHLEVYG